MIFIKKLYIEGFKAVPKTEHRFRVVEFTDYNEKTIKVCTDLMNITSEKVVDIYKERWEV